MTDDLISREAAIDALMELTEARRQWISNSSEEIRGIDAAICALEDLPAVQPKRFYVIDTKDDMCRLCDWQYLEELAHEEWARDLMWCDMEGFAIGENGELYLLDECGKWVEPPEGRFEIKWGGIKND